jgi:hypothetical protein
MSHNNGFLLVASVNYRYFMSALYCAESIKDYYPEASITLATHKEWVDDRCDVFDHIITEDFPIALRAKLWALDKTPYEKTLYVDADCEIIHEDIKLVFDQLKDHDVMFSEIRPYNSAVVDINAHDRLRHHGGVFLYNNKPNTIEFMTEWWKQWQKQRTDPWPFDFSQYQQLLLQSYDMFALFWLIEKERWKDRINIGIFENDARWNFHNGYRYSEVTDPIVIYHHTLKFKESYGKNIPTQYKHPY